MNRKTLEGLLGTSMGRDAGCEEVFALLDQYVEAKLAGRDVDALMPAIAEHLRHCRPCSEEEAALLTLIRENIGA